MCSCLCFRCIRGRRFVITTALATNCCVVCMLRGAFPPSCATCSPEGVDVWRIPFHRWHAQHGWTSPTYTGIPVSYRYRCPFQPCEPCVACTFFFKLFYFLSKDTSACARPYDRRPLYAADNARRRICCPRWQSRTGSMHSN